MSRFDARLSEDIAHLALIRQVAAAADRNAATRHQLGLARAERAATEAGAAGVASSWAPAAAHKAALMAKLSQLARGPSAAALRTLLGLGALGPGAVEARLLALLRERLSRLAVVDGAELGALAAAVESAEARKEALAVAVGRAELAAAAAEPTQDTSLCTCPSLLVLSNSRHSSRTASHNT